MQTAHQKRIEAFMRQAQQELPGSPDTPGDAVLQLRANLILEEALETINALGCTVFVDTSMSRMLLSPLQMGVSLTHDPNLIEIADGCADLSVVNIGTLSACGIKDQELLEEVDHNNLQKFGAGHEIRADGKLVKPPGHRPPDIERVLKGQGRA